MATIVSSVENIGFFEAARIFRLRGGLSDLRSTPVWRRAYFFEMMTVFMNASPMLSDDIEGSSATVR